MKASWLSKNKPFGLYEYYKQSSLGAASSTPMEFMYVCSKVKKPFSMYSVCLYVCYLLTAKPLHLYKEFSREIARILT